jgi:tetratricopeptide (TPR) repeat protein/tRNA A-37 threonylcarbamoyl transferase component Bud32
MPHDSAPTPAVPGDNSSATFPSLAESFGALPPLPTPDLVPALDIAPAPPELADYEILGELGRGGMGVVYQARHRKLDRVVALKVILAGAYAGSAELARFLAEAQAVARLQHPNIVQVFEWGEHQQVPYLALEFVSGGSLAERVRQAPLPPTKAAECVEQLARAVGCAHAAGIIHRDLKPENVLLTADGTPKVADFGLAKRVETGEPQAAAPGAADLTRPGSIVGTPNYMAPEQARGGRGGVGPAADIYSLGAILYRLLSGRPPFQAASVMDTLWQVLHKEPVALGSLQPGVPRDLETICLKCLEKEPARRYDSAVALADDLRRFRAGESILARPVGRAERLWKWARRRPAVAALSVALVAAVALGFALVTWKWLDERAARADAEASGQREREAKELAQVKEAEALAQRDLALRYFNKAQEAVNQLTLISESDDFLRSEPRLEHLRKRLLDEALAYYQAFLKDKSSDPTVRLATAIANVRIGDLLAEQGDKAAAEHAYRDGLAILEQLAAAQPGNAGARQGAAAGCSKLGLLLLRADRKVEAETVLKRSLDLYGALVEKDQANANYQDGLANARHNLAGLFRVTGRLSEAEAEFGRALQLREKLCDANPRSAEYAAGLAVTCNNLGLLLEATDRPKEAEKLYRRAVDLYDRLVRSLPRHAWHRADLAMSCTNLGQLLARTGGLEDAEGLLRRALALRERLADDFPKVAPFLDGLASSCNALGLFLDENGNKDEVEKLYRRAVVLREKLVEDFPTVADYRESLALACNNLAGTLEATDRSEAERLYHRAGELLEKLARDSPTVPHYRSKLAATCDNLGQLLRRDWRADEAEGFFRQGAELYEKLAGDYPMVAEYRAGLASICYAQATLFKFTKRPEEADKHYRRAAELLEKLVQDAPGVTAYRHKLALVCHNHAALLSSRGQLPESEKLCRRAAELNRQLAAELPTVAGYREALATNDFNLARLLERRGALAEAEAAYREAFALRLELASADPPDTTARHDAAVTAAALALLHVKQKHFHKGRQAYEHAVKLFEEALREAPADAEIAAELRDACIGLGGCSLKVERFADAAEAAERLLKVSGLPLPERVFAARLLSRCAKEVGPRGPREADAYAARAVEILTKAVAYGYRDAAELRTAPEYEPLRRRGDFKALLRKVDELGK